MITKELSTKPSVHDRPVNKRALLQYRISRALTDHKPAKVSEIWELLESIGFEPYVVLGREDFAEVLRHGGRLLRQDYATFSPDLLLRSSEVSQHVKALIQKLN